MKRIAVLLTCHNRCEKTKKCLMSLKDSLAAYNGNTSNSITIEIFLTDDGCTDDTAESARIVFPEEKVLHILKGDGSLYWAGGMRFCWREAMKRHDKWDYYLLLNDDAELKLTVFDELFNAEQYAIDNYGKAGIVSGITCSKSNENEITYGGDIWINKFLATRKRLNISGTPQLCDMVNANILLIPRSIVEKVGIFYDKYQHGLADFDYSDMVRKAGYPVMLTANFCGYCERDHIENEALANKITSMSFKERKQYFKNPIHSNKDYLRFICRTSPVRVLFVWFGRKLVLLFPKLYYHFHGKRGR